MLRRINQIFVFVVSVMGLLWGSAVRADAMTGKSVNGTLSGLPMALPSASSDQVTFGQLQQPEAVLVGPYDSDTFSFDLPPEWSLSGPAELDLLMGVSISSVPTSTTNPAPTVTGGTFTVRLNDTVLGVFSVNTTGEITQKIAAPAAAFKSSRTDGRMQLIISLDSGITCLENQQMMVVIHPSSYFVINHDTALPDTGLANYPRPIYERSIVPSAALLVVPDQPSPMELQAALTVAAGLGSLSANAVRLDIATVSQLTPALAATDVILVGKAASLPVLSQLPNPPLAASNGKFNIPGGGPDDGVIEMINSPWSTTNVVMVVSGNSDAGVVKAAQATSTGTLVANSAPNLSVVKDVRTAPAIVSVPQDQTLSALGYSRQRLTSLGINSQNYNFYVPAGQTVTSDAYFELAYGHSALMDFNRSAFVVRINGVPIGSVALNDKTAAVAENRAKFAIPPSVLVPGENLITVVATLEPYANCTSPNFGSLWMTVWPDSNLHLPFVTAQVNLTSAMDLSRYPSPFIFDPQMAHVAFVVQKNDLPSWRNAVQLASYLGYRSNPTFVALRSFYADAVTPDDRANYNFLLIGRPSQMPLISQQLNDSLPGPFQPNSDNIVDRSMQVIYAVPPGASEGYLEMLPSPWNNNYIVLLAVGTNAEGIGWSTAALQDTPLGGRRAGNLAVIQGNKMWTVDTRVGTSVVNAFPTANPAVQAPVQFPAPAPNPAPVQRPGWIIWVLILTLILAVVVVIFVIVSGSRARAAGSITDRAGGRGTMQDPKKTGEGGTKNR